MEKIFEKLPYDALEDVKTTYLLLGGFAIGLLFLGLYYFTLYSTTQKQLVLEKSKRDTTQLTLNRYRVLVSQKDLISQQVARAVGQLDTMRKQMPKTEEIPRLLERVANLGNGLGLQVLLFQLEEGQVKDFYKEIPVNIQFRGGLWRTLDFFDGIQNLLRLVNFTKLEMTVKQVALVDKTGPTGENVDMLHTIFIAKTFSYISGSETKIKKPAPKPQAKPQPAKT